MDWFLVESTWSMLQILTLLASFLPKDDWKAVILKITVISGQQYENNV